MPDRFRSSLRWWVVPLLLVGLAACTDAPDANTVHWTKAEFAIETSGDFEPPAVPPPALEQDGAWEVVDLPHARERRVGLPDTTGANEAEIAWYRFTLPEQVRRDAGDDVRLYLPRWQTVGALAVYADGKLIWRTRGSLIWNSSNLPVWLPLTQAKDTTPPRTILIRMASQRGVGGALSTVRAGPAETLGWRYRTRHLVQVDAVVWSSVTFAVIGLFALAVWCVRRREIIYLAFFTMATATLLRTLLTTGDSQSLGLSDAWFAWIRVNVTLWLGLMVLAVLLQSMNRSMPRLMWGLAIGSIATSIAVLPGLIPDAAATLVIPVALVILGCMCVIVGFWRAWRTGSLLGALLTASLVPDIVSGITLRLLDPSYALLTLYTLSLPGAVLAIIALWLAWRVRSIAGAYLAMFSFIDNLFFNYDALLGSNQINVESIYITPYGFSGLFAICLVFLWRRYSGLLSEVEAANSQLEVRLADQARELTASHLKLREFEQQQTLMQERQRIMREMHDGMGSSLISALRMVEHDPVMARMITECIDDLTLSIDSLTISDPDLVALLSTLRFRLEPRLKAAGVTLDWKKVGDVPPPPWLDAQSALHILRILQEVLANIIKHTRATRIAFATRVDDRNVEVVVGDNGAGSFRLAPFDEEAQDLPAAAPGGRGLGNITNRVRAIGARCVWIVSETGGVFILSLPMALKVTEPDQQIRSDGNAAP